jgi:cytochrome c-type biogenesis protein
VSEAGLTTLVVIPAGLGLFGFIEPCSIGASLIFIKYLEDKGAMRKLAETVLFTATRALFIGALGIAAALLGSAFLGLQRGAWIALGAGYVVLGMLYATGRARALMVAIGPGLSRLGGLSGSAGLGVLFGLNIPACAAHLLLAMLAAAAAQGATGATLATGFVSLGVFGLALSLPLVAAVLIPAARRWLDRLAALSGRFPLWAGIILVAFGLWSIGFGLFVGVEPPAS